MATFANTLPGTKTTSTPVTKTQLQLWFGVPWFVWAAAASVSCAVLGAHFDVSWHRSIGRDTFWSPAHMVLYSSGVLAAIFSGYLIFATTFGHNTELQRHSVRIWGLRAPFGAFVAAWGGLGALYDAIFDNWWHNAYGLDVRFTSPPHLLFSMSIWFQMLGGLLLTLSYLNRATSESQTSLVEHFNAKRLQQIVLYMGALITTSQLFVCFGYTFDIKLHQTKAYMAVAIFLPISLAMMARVTRHRWTCTILTAIYTAILILGLPLFPATPHLGPIYAPVTHFIPPRFPLLVIFPAIALDLIWQRLSLDSLKTALLSGTVFTALLVAFEWPFAKFLLSSASDNRFFGTRYLGFDDLSAPITPAFWHFEAPSHGIHLLVGLIAAALFASVGIYAGNSIGKWMSTVRR
jgi:hypothetical protein